MNPFLFVLLLKQERDDIMLISEAMEKGRIELKSNNIELPKLKSRLLMQYVLGQNRQYVIVHDDEKLEKNMEEKYFANIKKIKEGTPIEHITHQKEFMKLNFYVDSDVLIPRQDTEILVEEVIDIARQINAKRILDLCTGSGAIAVSLAKYLPNVEVTASDISKNALEIANKNAIANEVKDRINFIQSDLFENIIPEKYDIIVSNPPYIKRKEIKKLDAQVKKEPNIALDGGTDGLDFYRSIINDAYLYLKYGGYLCFEIGFDQRKEVQNLIEQNSEYYKQTYSKKDLYDKDRIVVTRLL